MKMKPLVAALVAGGLLGAGAAGAFNLPSWLQPGAKSGDKPAVVATAETAAPAAVPMIPAQGQIPDYRAIFRQSAPAVVGITVEGMHKTGSGDDEGPSVDSDPFFQFFRGMPGFQFRRGPAPSVPFKGQGSGFIVSADGLILTNAHVVREAKEVTVKLSDRREFSAKVLGSDPTTDIAVLKIDAKGLPVVRLGDPKKLEVGDPVMAIGAPYGFEQTATSGIVSAKGRSLPGDAVVPFIQTDAAVNPGNSGGPLFDGTGAVVGINAQIYSQSGGFQGLSFSIPIDVALKVKSQIVATGKASHARLGVTVQDLNQGLAESFGLAKPDGALISNVAADSAAATAGLKAGDVVTKVNGEPVERSGQLSSLIGLSAPGDKVKLEVWRDKSSREIEVKLGSADSKVALADDSGDAAPGGQLGLALRPLSSAERRQAHVDSGLVVEDVAGPAARAGVTPGDVLLAINGQPVQSVDQVQGVLKSKPRHVALLVWRDGEKIFVPIKLG
ncbi:MAG: Do family serine endopeptidase [Rubrivivax sp.]